VSTASRQQDPQHTKPVHIPGSPSQPAARVSSFFRWKGALDRVLAAALLLPGTPLMLVIWLVVRFTSNGPVLFRQVRVGKNEVNFVMIKFRTMVQNAEVGTGAIWASPNDPRLTRVGKLLRALHLDELPQIWNVLRGEMSLVGPRSKPPARH
jgi:lipopolysaccharide/colanic/teichoic acid biosynthesis glycosyltransferase